MFLFYANGKFTFISALTLVLAVTIFVVTSEEIGPSNLPRGPSFDSAGLKGARGAVRHNVKRALKPGKGSSKNSQKSAKGDFKEICLQTGFLFPVEGSDNVIFGPSKENPACEDKLPACTEESNQEFLQCMDNAGLLVNNWYFNRDTIGSFQFVQSPTIDGDGSFKGMVSSTPASKVELEYFNTELVDEKVGLLTNISFDYYIANCPMLCSDCSSCANTPLSCLTQIYVNIYTRNSPSSTSFYDCRFDYVLGQDIATDLTFQETGVWHSVSFNPLTIPKKGFAACALTFAEASAANYVLAPGYGLKAFEGCTDSVSVKLVVGDSNCQDDGMVVYFDNIRIDFPFSDGSDSHIYNFKV